MYEFTLIDAACGISVRASFSLVREEYQNELFLRLASRRSVNRNVGYLTDVRLLHTASATCVVERGASIVKRSYHPSTPQFRDEVMAFVAELLPHLLEA